MNITCPHCQARLNLPDDKIPRNRDSFFKCPKCRESIQIKAGQAAGSGDSFPGGGSSGAMVPHGAEVLVCVADPGAKAKVMEAVQQSGWPAEAVSSPDQALKRLEYESFALLIMDEAFDDTGAMASYLNELDMSLRRRTCLVRISSRGKTGDAMMALHTSSNFVIHAGDVAGPGLSDLLVSARTDHDKLYRVYMDSMRAVGKA